MTFERSPAFWQSLKDAPLHTLHEWQASRLTWLFMLGTAVFLELSAFGFQYILHMDPCELCVYQRLAVLMLAIAPLIIMISPINPVLRIAGYALWITAAVYGLDSAITQTGDYEEIDPFNYNCSFRPVFPFDLPLYEWMPSVFMPTGICGSDDWTLLGLNMAQWMVGVFSLYLLSSVICIASTTYCLLFNKQ